jgi:transposase
MLKNVPVPMPETHKAFKTVRGTRYVYHILRSYRKEGKPTYDSICIGKEDEKSGLLIPNLTYFKIFQNERQKIESSEDLDINNQKSSTTQNSVDCNGNEIYSLDYGNYLVLMHITKELGLDKIIEKVFPDNFEQILKIAFFMVCEGNTMSKIVYWQKSTYLKLGEFISDSRCSQIFADITFEQRMRFFQEWMSLHAQDGQIVYDVTIIQSYSKQLTKVQWGYRRKHQNLPQINLGMYYGQKSGLPVYYNIYQGSINDKTDLIFMVEHTKSLGLTNVLFVVDRGFFTDINIQYVINQQYHIIIPLLSSMKIYRQLIKRHRKNIRQHQNRINEFNIYGLSINTDISGINLNAHIYYDLERAKYEDQEFEETIEDITLDLESKKIPKKLTRFNKKFFNINTKKQDDKTVIVDYSINNELINNELKYHGYFILVCSDKTLSSASVLHSYKQRDKIEKQFMVFKNTLDFNRFRTQADYTTDGKMFLEFLALILTAAITKKINSENVSKQLKRLSTQDIIMLLKEFRLISINGSQSKTTLSKIQKESLKILEVPGYQNVEI